MKWHIAVFVLVASIIFLDPVQAAPSRIERLLEGRMASNCFFSPMGCVFIPNRQILRARRLLREAQKKRLDTFL